MRSADLLLLVATGVCALGCDSLTTSQPQICDGISAEVGGCDVTRASFAATDCDGIAAEFGRRLEGRVSAIISGPESTFESKATRTGNAVVLTAQLANRHIREVGLTGDCPPVAFMMAAEAGFSAAFKADVGGYLYDGSVVDYPAWRAFVVGELAILDSDGS